MSDPSQPPPAPPNQPFVFGGSPPLPATPADPAAPAASSSSTASFVFGASQPPSAAPATPAAASTSTTSFVFGASQPPSAAPATPATASTPTPSFVFGASFPSHPNLPNPGKPFRVPGLVPSVPAPVPFQPPASSFSTTTTSFVVGASHGSPTGGPAPAAPFTLMPAALSSSSSSSGIAVTEHPDPRPAIGSAPFPLQSLIDRPQVGPSLGARVLADIPLIGRVQLRALSREMCSAVDTSLAALTRLSLQEDLAEVAARRRPEALTWLVSKCPNLISLTVATAASSRGGELTIELPEDDVTGAAADASNRGGASARVGSSGLGSSGGGSSAGIGTCAGGVPTSGRGGPGMTCWWRAAGINPTGGFLLELALTCRHLRHLTLKRCCGVTDAGLRAVAIGCRDLRSVNVKGCAQVTDAGVKYLARHSPQLEELNLGFCGLITDGGLSRLARGCPGLTALTLTFKQSVTDAGIRSVAERCKGLRRLKVRQCRRVTDGGIAAVAFGCRELAYLDVGDGPSVSDVSISMVASSCKPGLESLLVGSAVTHVGLAAVIHSSREGLKRLRVRDNAGLKDRTVELLARSCPLLLRLDLAHCRDVTDAGMAVVTECCPLLEELVLEKCVAVTDGSMVPLAERCPRLRGVNWNHCPGVTDGSVAALGRNCPDLVSLRVSGSNLSDASLVKIAARGRLRTLDVSGCFSLTTEAFRKLGECCKGLDFVIATGVKVPKGELSALLPRCQVDCSRYWFLY